MKEKIWMTNPELSDKLKEKHQKLNLDKQQRGVLKKFNQDKLGMFVHWGLYSVPSGKWKGKEVWGMGEWIMWHANIPRAEYAELANNLTAEKFNAAEWVGLAKKSGMKYIVVTAKHHDGFALWHSKCSKFNISDSSTCNVAILDELYTECQKQGLGFGLYYSHVIDWNDGWEGEGGSPDSDPRTRDREKSNPMNTWDPPNVTRQDYFNKKAYPQVRELLERFPNLYVIWFDYWYQGKYLNPPEAFKFYQLVSETQPDCLVNSRVDGYENSNTIGDYITAGDNIILAPGQTMPWETPGTLNNTWGYSERDNDWKNKTELIYFLVNVISRGGNYLLNIGPRPDGSLPEQTHACFNFIAEWMKINSEAVYGTTMWEVDKEGPNNGDFGGTLQREEEGFRDNFTSEDLWFTAKGDSVYTISLVWPNDNKVLVKSMQKTDVKSVTLLGTDKSVSWELTPEGLKVKLPNINLNSIGFVLKIII